MYTSQDDLDLGITLACSTDGSMSQRVVSHFPTKLLKTQLFPHLPVLAEVHPTPASMQSSCKASSLLLLHPPTHPIATGFGSLSRSPRVTNESV